LPQFGWRDIAQTWVHSCDEWPTDRLAVPRTHDDDFVEYETPIGTLWFTENYRRYAGLFALEQMRGVYERGAVRINVGDTVVDLGGHIGSFTRYAFTRGARIVIVFEPEPTHIRCLEHCFAHEIAAGRLHLIRAAAWKEKTVLRFQQAGVESRVHESGELRVLSVTVDEVANSLQLKQVDFIKADIEGAERVALGGAKETIAKFAPRMVFCTYHLADDPVVIPAIVQRIRRYDVSFNMGRSQVFFRPLPAH
jgi:FkbM family methyltransferase